MVAVVSLFAAACGSRTGDYGYTGTGGDVGCKDVGQACSVTADCCDATCDSGFCGGTCTPNGATCTLDADCCGGACEGGVCGDACGDVGESCGAGAACCDPLGCFDGFCSPLECLEDGQLCGDDIACCSGVCDAGTCGFGECLPDGAGCVDFSDCCSFSCVGGVCGSPGCTHDECQQGAPLDRFCTGCTSQVCDLDPFCCEQLWDEACVASAEQTCGLDCMACTPNGSQCMTGGECCSGSCAGGVCANPCQPDGAPCNFAQQCCGGQCNDGFCGPGGDCSHDECTQGGPLEPACSPCTGQICGMDPFCCQQAWDGICVDEAQQFCGLNCGNCTPDGGFCMVPGDCCSNQCNGNVCGFNCLPDGSLCNFPGECCSNQCNGNICGFNCTPDGGFCNVPGDCCGNQCSGNVCGPSGDCSHDECTTGGPLLDSCTPCTAQVCSADPFCCEQSWDGLCVDEAEQFCMLDCGTCTPDGGMCNDGGECCNGSCNDGVCGPPCLPNGSFCFQDDQCCNMQCDNFQCGGLCFPDGAPCGNPGQCCSNQCSNGFCGSGPVCPSDGSPCGDCVAQSCCGQLVGCLTSPGCIDDVFCFQSCVGGGTPLPLCFFQCIDDPAAFDVLTCLAGNCAAACL